MAIENEAVGKFDTEIRRIVDYFREEFDVSYAEAIGVLDMRKTCLLLEVLTSEKEDEK